MSARTTSPSNPMFVKLLKNWNDIRANIDSNNLNKLVLPAEGFLRTRLRLPFPSITRYCKRRYLTGMNTKKWLNLGL